MSEKRRCLAVVRVRGVGDASPKIERTLELLHLNRNCHITLVDSRSSILGMLKRARKFVTWGEASKESIALLLKKRGRLVGDKRVDEEYVKKAGFKDLEELAAAIYNLEVDLQRLTDFKPVFRGHPPKKGYKGKIKKSYNVGGVTGYRGEAINKLIVSMA